MVIGYHGGCPDGCAATHILHAALLAKFPRCNVQVVAMAHQTNRFVNVVKEGMIVFSVDITPSLADIEVLRTAHSVIIMDHHASEEDTQKQIMETCTNVVNLSDNRNNECAATLALKLAKPLNLSFDADTVHMFHKMDVFEHNLPPHLADQFPNFKAFITQRGERNVQLDLVKQMFEDRESCLSQGQELAAQVQQCTEELASGLAVVAEKEGTWRVMLAEQAEHCRPIDFGQYQQQIDAHKSGVPTLVVTLDTRPLPNGLFNLGLRRAGPELDVSIVAAKLKELPEFVGGGGHPFAGGAQTKELLALNQVVELIRKVMLQVF